jgi:hypothetical protein
MMRGDPELAASAVRTIHDLWKVDADCVEWVGDTSADTIFKFGYGFDWWPGDFKVAIRVHGPHPELEAPIYRLSAHTDFLCDVDTTTADFAKGLTTLNRWVPTFSICAFPTSIAEALNKYTPPKTSLVSKLFGKREPDKAPMLDPKSSKVWLSSNTYLTKQKEEWLPHYFSGLSLLQGIESQARASDSILLLGGKEDRSQHPRLGPRTSLDDMLNWEIDIGECGKAKSAWIGTGEFEGIVDRWCRSDTAFGVVHNDGLYAHTPFGDDTAILRMVTDQPHPQLGSGLLAMLHIPVVSDPQEAEATCVSLNYLESTVWSKRGIPFVGSWSASESQNSNGERFYTPTFQCFIPNMMYRFGIAENFVLHMLERARWARQTLWPTVVDSSMEAIASRRLNIEPT